MLLALAATRPLAPRPAAATSAPSPSWRSRMLIGGNGLVVWAEQTMPSGTAALLVATVPIWMAGLAALPPARERLPASGDCRRRPRLPRRRRLGASERPGAIWSRSLALVLASFSWSCGSIYARHAGIRADPITVTAWEMFFAGLMFLALGTATGGVFTARFDGAGLAAILYLIVVGSWIGLHGLRVAARQRAGRQGRDLRLREPGDRPLPRLVASRRADHARRSSPGRRSSWWRWRS